jgi:hypothetical protein
MESCTWSGYWTGVTFQTAFENATRQFNWRFVIRRIPSYIAMGEYCLSFQFAYRCKLKGLALLWHLLTQAV